MLPLFYVMQFFPVCLPFEIKAFKRFYFLPFFQYSIDNYEERRKYELQAERIREEMQARLGSHPDEIDSQNERLNALRRVDSQINELKRMSESTTQPQIPAGASARMLQQPRSANLEQLYHEAIPMNKALSHSGPSAFGNGQGLLQQHPVSLKRCLFPPCRFPSYPFFSVVQK